MKNLAIVCAAVLMLLPPVLAAQDFEPVQTNDRLRFAAPSAGFAIRITGTVTEVRDGDLHMVLGQSPTDPAAMLVVVPVASITQLERSAGRRSRLRTGIYGTVLGTGFGAVAGVLQSRMQTHQSDVMGNRSGLESHVMEITLAGAGIGALVGALLPGERWRPLGVAALSVDRAAFRVSESELSFRLSF